MNKYCPKCHSEKLCLYTKNGVELILRCNNCDAEFGTVGLLPETVNVLDWMIDLRLKEVKE